VVDELVVEDVVVTAVSVVGGPGGADVSALGEVVPTGDVDGSAAGSSAAVPHAEVTIPSDRTVDTTRVAR
jgi:hypothetical protein